MLWIPITVFAALAQTIRNAAQRHLVTELGTLGATLVRFLYGLPFALLWLGAAASAARASLPAPTLAFLGWCLAGGLAQIVGTALLLATMRERNFAVGVAYSKTEVVQVALLSFVLLGDRLTAGSALAVAAGTLGVLLLAPADRERPFASLVEGLASKSALMGLGCGAGMAMSAVSYRAATQVAGTPSWIVNAALTVAVAQFMQTLILGGWLLWRSPEVVTRTLRAWRASLFAGFMGAAASIAWFTAFAIQSVTYVRTLGLVEMPMSYLVSRRIFRERLTPREIAGMALIGAGAALIVTLA
ncbi:MAG: DMT family transporter [Burkholderiales bacterium]